MNIAIYVRMITVKFILYAEMEALGRGGRGGGGVWNGLYVFSTSSVKT